MICKWCGNSVNRSDSKCRRCGKSAAPLSQCGGFYDLVPAARPVAAPVPAPGTPTEKENKQSMLILILAVVCGVLAVLLIWSWIANAGLKTDIEDLEDELDDRKSSSSQMGVPDSTGDGETEPVETGGETAETTSGTADAVVTTTPAPVLAKENVTVTVSMAKGKVQEVNTDSELLTADCQTKEKLMLSTSDSRPGTLTVDTSGEEPLTLSWDIPEGFGTAKGGFTVTRLVCRNEDNEDQTIYDGKERWTSSGVLPNLMGDSGDAQSGSITVTKDDLKKWCEDNNVKFEGKMTFIVELILEYEEGGSLTVEVADLEVEADSSQRSR